MGRTLRPTTGTGRYRRPIAFGLCLLSALAAAVPAAVAFETPPIRNWLCYYGGTYGPEVYTRFDLVVLDGRYHPPLERLTAGRPILLGYVSVGEVDIDGPGWETARGQPYLVRENRFWSSWVVDVRDPRWQSLLLEKLVPQVLLEGFDGLFLDTFDSALALAGDGDGRRFAGVDAALVEIVRHLRRTYPAVPIAVNRGLPVLPAIAREIDYILVEDLYSFYDPDRRRYRRVDADTRRILLDQVAAGRRVAPGLTVLTLDYAEADQIDLAREAIGFSRRQGFVPYVSTIALDQVFLHTLDRR